MISASGLTHPSRIRFFNVQVLNSTHHEIPSCYHSCLLWEPTSQNSVTWQGQDQITVLSQRRSIITQTISECVSHSLRTTCIGKQMHAYKHIHTSSRWHYCNGGFDAEKEENLQLKQQRSAERRRQRGAFGTEFDCKSSQRCSNLILQATSSKTLTLS